MKRRGELIIVAGEPGVGKSFVADEIGKLHDATVFDSDELRHEIADEPVYNETESYLTYGEMFYRGRRALERGEDVVLDATFSTETTIDRAEHIADMTDSEFTIVRVHCNDWVELNRRLDERPDDGAGMDVYKKIRDRFEPIDRERVDIFNHTTKPDTISQLIHKL